MVGVLRMETLERECSDYRKLDKLGILLKLQFYLTKIKHLMGQTEPNGAPHFGQPCFGRRKLLQYLCPSTVHRETPQRSGLNLASWGM